MSQEVLNNSKNTDNSYLSVKKVLILYEEELPFLGDCCLQFDKLRYFKSFLNEAFIQLNFKKVKNSRYHESLLKNNPYVDEISTLDWDDINFKAFDIIFCVSHEEEDLAHFLKQKYRNQASPEDTEFPIYSITDLLLKARMNVNYVFPVMHDLARYLKTTGPGELYINEDEERWANSWFEQKGILPDENLYIILDSAGSKLKQLPIQVYFELLNALLDRPKTKILIFDEKNLGKEIFYREWLGADKASNLIFSNGLTLREDLCLLSSTYVKMIFGPCTGLMHCSSSIYNLHLAQGLPIEKIPLLVVYSGDIGTSAYNLDEWWASSPLINCLILQKTGTTKKITVLGNIPDGVEKSPRLPCSEYTVQLLLDFLTPRLSK